MSWSTNWPTLLLHCSPLHRIFTSVPVQTTKGSKPFWPATKLGGITYQTQPSIIHLSMMSVTILARKNNNWLATWINWWFQNPFEEICSSKMGSSSPIVEVKIPNKSWSWKPPPQWSLSQCYLRTGSPDFPKVIHSTAPRSTSFELVKAKSWSSQTSRFSCDRIFWTRGLHLSVGIENQTYFVSKIEYMYLSKYIYININV